MKTTLLKYEIASDKHNFYAEFDEETIESDIFWDMIIEMPEVPKENKNRTFKFSELHGFIHFGIYQYDMEDPFIEFFIEDSIWCWMNPKKLSILIMDSIERYEREEFLPTKFDTYVIPHLETETDYANFLARNECSNEDWVPYEDMKAYVEHLTKLLG